MKNLLLLFLLLFGFSSFSNAQNTTEKPMQIDILLLKTDAPKFQLGIETSVSFFIPKKQQGIGPFHFEIRSFASPSAMLKLKYNSNARWSIISGLGWSKAYLKEGYYCDFCDQSGAIPLYDYTLNTMNFSVQTQFKQRTCIGDFYATTGLQYGRLISEKTEVKYEYIFQSMEFSNIAFNENMAAILAGLGWSKKLGNKLEIATEIGYAYHFVSMFEGHKKDLGYLHKVETKVGLYYKL